MTNLPPCPPGESTSVAPSAPAHRGTPVVSVPLATPDWRRSLPVLCGDLVTLRELSVSDAHALLAMFSTDEVARLIAAPPPTVEGFERFVEYMQQHRQAGDYACFAIVPHGSSTAAGLFQIRQLEPGFRIAEWGFALGAAFWGSGVFMDGARLALRFVFETLDVHRLEARAALINGRGNGALRKLGAVQELILRRGFLARDGKYLDQALWSILATDWRAAHEQWPAVH